MRNKMRILPEEKICECYGEPQGSIELKEDQELLIHDEPIDENNNAWLAMKNLIEESKKDGREIFDPCLELGDKDFTQLITLPKEIGQLKNVKKLVLLGSHLNWLPPEIGDMEALEEIETYGSYSLHWYPYELLNCKNINSTFVSTRALYGNFKNYPLFPNLNNNKFKFYGGNSRCSICKIQKETHQLNRYWVSIAITNDVYPFLVQVCSDNCFSKIQTPEQGYVNYPHTGGLGIKQPKGS